MAMQNYQLRMSFDKAEPVKTVRERVALVKAKNLAELIEKAWA
jgi:hypothetical protein